MELYHRLPDLKVDTAHIQHAIDDKQGWQEITPERENHGYVQYYKKYEPDWLKDQLYPIWSYMGLLVACRAGELLIPHVDTGRSAAILIPCTDSYEENTLDFWHIPEWEGTIGKQQKFHDYTNGHIIDSVIYTEPLLFRNVPHGVDNRKSSTARINLSVCFMEPYTYDVVKDLHTKGMLIK